MSPILITVPRGSTTTTRRPHRGLIQLTGHARCGAIERTLTWHLAGEVILPPAGRQAQTLTLSRASIPGLVRVSAGLSFGLVYVHTPGSMGVYAAG